MSAKYALIIANTEYTDPGLARLTAPGKDAKVFADVLEAKELCAFDDVQILLDQPEPVVREAIDSFFDKKKPDDLLILYFSGHGVRDEYGSLYLAVKNTNRARLRATAVKSDFIRESMDQSRSRRQVLILDCCNSGAFAQGTKAATGVSIGTASAFEGTGYGRVVLTASDATQFAWEGDKVIGETENSLFTHFLVKGLQGEADNDGDGRITIDELYDYAYGEIVSITPKQTPGKWSFKQQGEIVLRQSAQPQDIKPAALPEDLIREIEDPRSYVRQGAVERLAGLLRERNIGIRRAAEDALQQIAADKSNTPNVVQSATDALEAFRQAQQKAQAERAALQAAEKLAFQKAEEERVAREKAEAEARATSASTRKVSKQQILDEKQRAEEQAAARLRAREVTEQLSAQMAAQAQQAGLRKASRRPWIIASLFGTAGIFLVAVIVIGYVGFRLFTPRPTVPAETAAVEVSSGGGETPTLRVTTPPVSVDANGVVYSVAFSPDGTMFASGSKNNTIMLWDAAGKPIGQPLEGHSGPVNAVTFSPNGKLLASASDDGTVLLWDTATGQQSGEALRGHTDHVTCLAFSPDGTILASGSWDTNIILWDVQTHQPIGEPLAGHTDAILSVAFSPDGTLLASGGDDKTVIVWDVATRKELGAPLKLHTDAVSGVAFSPDGATLAVASWDQTVVLWDLASRRRVGQPMQEQGQGQGLTGVAFSPDGKTLAAGSWDDSVIVWDVGTQQQIGQPLEKHSGTVNSVAFSPDGKKLASGGQDSAIILWDMATVLANAAP